MAKHRRSTTADRFSTLLIIFGATLIIGGVIYYFVPTPPPQPLIDDFKLIYQSEKLSDEELAGSIPTPLNYKAGTIQQNLGINP